MSEGSIQHWREGVGAYNAGNIQKAISEFKSAAPSKGVLFNLGVSTAKLGDNRSAIRHFDEVLQMDPSLGVAYLTRGACKHHERMYEAAVADYDRALACIGNGMCLDYSGEGLQFEMNTVDLLFNRALALKEMGQIAEAQSDTAKAKKLVDGKTMNRQAALDKLANQLNNLAMNASKGAPPPQNMGAPANQMQQPPPNMGPGPGQFNGGNSSNPPMRQPHGQGQPPPNQAPKPGPGGSNNMQPGPPAGQAAPAQPPAQPPAPAAAPAPPQVQNPQPPPQAVPAPAPAAPAGGGGSAGFFSVDILTGSPPFPDGIDPTKRESYLSPEDFQGLFNCSKDDFYAMPKWKQELLKKKKGLF